MLTYGDALRLCNDREVPDHAPAGNALLEEILVFLWQYNLRPASIVRYDRQALIRGECDIGLRVTFDTSLSFQSHPLHLHEQPAGVSMLAANVVVMEIKVNERIPYWLTDLIAANNLRLSRISKYCRSITASGNMPSSQWQIPIAEPSRAVLASCLSSFSTLEREMGIARREDTIESVEEVDGHCQRARSDQ